MSLLWGDPIGAPLGAASDERSEPKPTSRRDSNPVCPPSGPVGVCHGAAHLRSPDPASRVPAGPPERAGGHSPADSDAVPPVAGSGGVGCPESGQSPSAVGPRDLPDPSGSPDRRTRPPGAQKTTGSRDGGADPFPALRGGLRVRVLPIFGDQDLSVLSDPGGRPVSPPLPPGFGDPEADPFRTGLRSGYRVGRQGARRDGDLRRVPAHLPAQWAPGDRLESLSQLG